MDYIPQHIITTYNTSESLNYGLLMIIQVIFPTRNKLAVIVNLIIYFTIIQVTLIFKLID